MDGVMDSLDMSLSKLLEFVIDRGPGVLQSMSCIETHMTERLNRTTEEAANHRSLLTQQFYFMSQFSGISLVGSH